MSTYTCHSGGAEGADIYWEVVGEQYGVKTIAYSFHGHKQYSENPYIMKAEELLEGWKHIEIAELNMKRDLVNIEHNPYMRNLLCRNWFQVKHAENIYAIGTFHKYNKQQVDGGTGWAVQMGIDNGKPVYVFEQNHRSWYVWDDIVNKFVATDIPTLTKNFAGIGTRSLNKDGERAIIQAYQKTFE